LLVSTVVADAGNFQIPAIAKIPAPALATRTILTSMPANADALPLLPRGNSSAHFIDDAGDFVPWNAGILNSRPGAFFRENVTVADTTGLHLDPHVSCVRHRNLALYDLEIRSGSGNLRHFHCCYCDCRCHKSSYDFLRSLKSTYH
jgi:hypothetical protein